MRCGENLSSSMNLEAYCSTVMLCWIKMVNSLAFSYVMMARKKWSSNSLKLCQVAAFINPNSMINSYLCIPPDNQFPLAISNWHIASSGLPFTNISQKSCWDPWSNSLLSWALRCQKISDIGKLNIVHKNCASAQCAVVNLLCWKSSCCHCSIFVMRSIA